MGTRVFFILTLLSPVVAAAYAFGGAFYLLAAIALAANIKQTSTRQRLFWLSIRTPPLFALALAWSVEVSGVEPVMINVAVQVLLNVLHVSAAARQQITGSPLSASLTLAICVSFIGYIYVAIAWMLWQCLETFGVIRDDLAA